MNKKFTLRENLEHKVQKTSEKILPQKSTIQYLMQFARVYTVEKSKSGSFIEFVLN